MRIVNRLWQRAQKARELAQRLPFLVPSAPSVPLLLLPEPLPARVGRAERAFGVRLLDDGGVAVVRAFGSPRKETLRKVGVADTPLDLARALGTGVPWLIFLSCVYGVNLRPFSSALKSARKQLPGNLAFSSVLDGIADWAAPRPGAAHIVRRGVAWALSEMVTEGVGSSALVDALPVSYNGYGTLLYEILHRRQNGVVHTDHPLIGVASQLEFASDYLRVDGQYQAIWAFVPRGISELLEVLRLDVDLLTLLENVGGQLYATCLLRAGGSNVEDLGEVGRSLSAFGAVRRLHGVELGGYDLEDALRSFVPGGRKPQGDRFSVEDNSGFLTALTAGIDMKSVTSGDTFIGSRDGRPVFISRRIRPSGAIVGPPTTGKTTLASALALQNPDGANVLTVHFTSVPGEAPPIWAKVFGGQALNLRLPSLGSAEDLRRTIETDDWAKRYWTAMKSQWRQGGYPLGMPITLRLESGSPVRFVAVSLEFLRGFLEAWKDLHEQTGVHGVLVLDDVIGIGGHDDDPVLGELPRLLASQMRELVHQVADTGRKAGLTTIVTAHSLPEFRGWPDGFWESLAFGVLLKPDGQFSQATLIEPSQCPLDGADGTLNGVLVSNLDVRLPRVVVETLGRRLDLPVHSGA